MGSANVYKMGLPGLGKYIFFYVAFFTLITACKILNFVVRAPGPRAIIWLELTSTWEPERDL